MKYVLCVFGCFVLSQAAVAQEPLIPTPGSRVRVTTETSRTTGTLESIDSATFVVRTRNGRAVPFQRESDFELDVSAGPGTCGAGRRFGCVVLGFLGGGLVGIGVGAIAVSDCDDDLCGLLYLVTVPAGALVGTVVGALLPGDHWNRAELPALTYLVPEAAGERRIGLGVRLWF
jgi:hypothetical protein